MIREIKIKPVLNGFVCDIGCQTVVFETPAALANAIEEYFIKPDEVEQRYREKAINRALLSNQFSIPPAATNTMADFATTFTFGSPVPAAPSVQPSP